ncbi:MAG: YdeI/OmpD-associated family protein [Saprospiraceae bacterium]|nr:YdeI/OmpD-associated family protein [Saprospiraceae bacterium]
MNKFRAEIELIGINPYVLVPEEILKDVFEQAGRVKGHIPIRGVINQKPYKQTLLKYKGAWRLYINATMLQNSPKRIGETIDITMEFDSDDRTIEPHPKLVLALKENKEAKKIFDNLSPSRQNEIVRYISRLKAEESIARNVNRAINYLIGNERFIGRDKP